MERIIVYLLGCLLASGMLAAYYWIALRNRRMHRYNRIYLLGSLALSLLLPLARIGWTPFGYQEGVVLSGAVQRATAGGGAAGAGIPWMLVGGWLVAGVSLCLLTMVMWRVIQVYRMKQRQAFCRMGGYDLIETDDPRAPFSFLNNLFWRRGEDPGEPVNQKILTHELAHIHGRHSWDGLFAQVLCCLFWMNPFFWLMRRELAVVHEFIADAATGMEGDAEGFARMLLQSMNAGRWLEPAQGFFQSPIKRRLMMVGSGRRVKFSGLRLMLAAPVLLMTVLVVSCSKEQSGGLAVVVPDDPKLAKEQLDLKIKRLVVLGKENGKLRLAVDWDSTLPVYQQKRVFELQLDKVKIEPDHPEGK